MKHLVQGTLAALCMISLGCGEELEPAQDEGKQGEDHVTLEQSLNMDLNVDWHDHDTMRITFRFAANQWGNRDYTVCVRPQYSGSWWPFCETFEPSIDHAVCDAANECTTAVLVPAQGGCGDVQEVRVQEGAPPFYREVQTATLDPCGWIDGQIGGTFVAASGGYPAGCRLSPSAPAGTIGFTYQGYFYHNASSPGYCPLPGSSFDGVNCKVRPIPREPGFVRWPGDFLYRPYNCN